jgi:hypothetical protein
VSVASGPQFPDVPLGTDPPAEVPPGAAVHVRHRGRFNAEGYIGGTVAGSMIDLTLQLPWPFGSAEGVLGDEPVAVTWDLRTRESDRPKTLRGTVGTQAVSLEGVFRLQPDFIRGIPAGKSFSGGSVQGTLTGLHLAATVEPTTGSFSGTPNVVATGSLDDHQFEIVATRNGRPMRGDTAAIGHFRGTYDGRTVHLDLAPTDQYGDTDVTGACPAPPAFTTLLIAALLFFT